MSTRPKKNVAAIILAAGDSRRMGSPKALLQIGNQTFLNKIIADYRQIGCQPIMAVAGAQIDTIRDSLNDPSVHLLHNPDPARGAFSSLKIAVENLPPQNQGIFVHPVDHPGVKVSTLRQLLAAWSGESDAAVKPSFQNRGGHPILLGRNWIRQIEQAPISSELRSLLRAFLGDLKFLAVPDEMILLNVNHPDDLSKISPHV